MSPVSAKERIEGLAKAALGGNPPDVDQILYLLSLKDPAHIHHLLQTAAGVRDRVFGREIFLYGFLYISTHCRNNCRFCAFRKANSTAARYRVSNKDALAYARLLARSGVHLIDLTMGEDPALYDPRGLEGFSALAGLVSVIKQETGRPVMVSPGVLPNKAFSLLADAGADWLALYQETHTPALFEQLRPGQGFQERMEKKHLAKQANMLVEDGVMCHVGETPEDLAASILIMGQTGADQMRAMTFVPQAGTPMAKRDAGDNLRERMVTAVMRICHPSVLIPASLDVDGAAGLADRLCAGANVVTSIIPPEKGLAGVANPEKDIDTGNRTVEHVAAILKTRGLTPASQASYDAWVAQRKKE